MIVRVVIGAGLFALGYFLGKEIGRTESVRDELEWAADEDNRMSTKPEPEHQVNPGRRPTDD
ncbi:MAG: hypothetical protein LJE70_01425 [Chromatiaceae bacterium]|jgi:hypothetical protein|nr:hypothetical protein [Chromatiaceae bacterium]